MRIKAATQSPLEGCEEFLKIKSFFYLLFTKVKSLQEGIRRLQKLIDSAEYLVQQIFYPCVSNRSDTLWSLVFFIFFIELLLCPGLSILS